MNNEKVQEILLTRRAGYVRRWHTVQHVNRHQTDAEHSAHALSLLFLFCPEVTQDMARVMLWHDNGELGVGDVPSPVLRANPEYDRLYKISELNFIVHNFPELSKSMLSLTADQKQWIRECDILELCLFAEDELALGNIHFDDPRQRGLGYLSEMDTLHPEVRNFIDALWVKKDGSWERK